MCRTHFPQRPGAVSAPRTRSALVRGLLRVPVPYYRRSRGVVVTPAVAAMLREWDRLDARNAARKPPGNGKVRG